MKILIIGGYGVFGGRLAHLLSDRSDLHLLIAGRSYNKAQALCNALQGHAKSTPVLLDRNALGPTLETLKPDLVVDASGPFQAYTGDPYSAVRACIEHAINYLDFADGADFVFGISQFDQAARDAGIFVLSGVSSFPVLTAAVVQEAAKTMTVQSVTGGIAPSPYAGIGLNVMRAVVGYAGGPVQLTRNGKRHNAFGLTESMRFTIAPPGKIPLHNLRFSLVDVPDLQVIPPLYPEMQDIWMGAGPVPESLHRVLNLLAKARAKFNLPAFTPFSSVFYRVLNLMKFGDHRGGMFVDVTGRENGALITRSWHLLAEGDDGPYIPSMAIEAIVRKILSGTFPKTGARAATDALTLADYDRVFANRTIHYGWRNSAAQKPHLYQAILGNSFDDLPQPLQDLHSPLGQTTWEGFADVQRGTNPIARLLARFFGFPHQGASIPVSVTFTPSQQSEEWVRNFNGKKFKSSQSLGTGRNTHLLMEKFGPITVALAVEVRGNQLHLIPRRWFALGIPLPTSLLPKGDSFEHDQNGVFNFDVTIAAPIIGLIAAYQGSLKPSDP